MPHPKSVNYLLFALSLILIAPIDAKSANEPIESPKAADEVKAPSRTIVETVRALPGQLDSVEMFNSNSPEIVKNTGILVSTFPATSMAHSEAHLNHALTGEINFFLHHINNRVEEKDLKTVYVGLLVYNSSTQTANVKVLTAASNLSQPDAPFVTLPPLEKNDAGEIFAGPGDRSMLEILRGQRDDKLLKEKVEIPSHHYALLLNQPIPVDKLNPPVNGRSALIKIETDQPLYAATLSSVQSYEEKAPTLKEWQKILEQSDLVTPRERSATEPGKPGPIIYGRVAGVQKGSLWIANIVNSKDNEYYEVGQIETQNFPISTVPGHTFDTTQIQSAPLIVRNAESAYLANGNYAVHYSLRIPMHNTATVERMVTIRIQNPLSDAKNNFYFSEPASTRVFFRGSVKVTSGLPAKPEVHFFHLVMHQGERGPAVFQKLLAGSKKEEVQIDLYYPPDATPPQVLTIKSGELVE